jgi:UDP-perosamine 4-acetyltransferase
VIESGAFVGMGANILPRSRVGKDATVAAGSCVFGRVEAGTTVVGVPARPMRR